LWRESMADLGITAIGCHASKCANGAPPYDRMSVKQREEIQHRLIVDIVASRLFAAVAIIDMDGYRAHRDELMRFLKPQDRSLLKPHVRAVEQCVYQMLKATKATGDPIAFICDQNQASGRMVKRSLDVARKNPESKFSHRIGPYTEDSRLSAVGLQAADILAYSAYRHARGNTGWQWKVLGSAIKSTELTTDARYWSLVLEQFRERQR
jgi:hypothetical protein